MELQEALDALASAKAELATTKEALKAANDESKGHRLNGNNFRKQVDELKEQLDAKDVEHTKAMKKATDDAEKLRLDLTGRATAAETAAQEARTKAQERARAADLRVAASEAGLRDIDALKLLDPASLKLNDDGDVTNAGEALAAMKAAKPYLFGSASTSSPHLPPSNDPAPVKRAMDMTPAERLAGAKALGITALKN
jgi:hypothetical protein